MRALIQRVSQARVVIDEEVGGNGTLALIREGMTADGVVVLEPTALHMHPAFAPAPHCRHAGELQGSRYAFDHCLTLPLYHEMTEADQDYVVDMLLEILERKR